MRHAGKPFAINYYLNGHGNKMQVDFAIIQGESAGSRLLADPYVGLPGGPAGQGANTYGMLIRFQWQLAL